MTAACKLKKRRPSPVNISHLRAKPKLYPPLNWSAEYGESFSSQLVLCDEDAIRVYLSQPEESFIWGGPLTANYILRNITFHWSLRKNKGSEHTFDDKHYPVEMQVVHEKIESEDDSKDAKEADNFLVVSYMFELSDIPNEALQNILDTVPKSIKYANQFVPSEPFRFCDLIEKFTKNYLFYKGQLTEPQFDTCYWLFCPCKLLLSPKQLCIFKKCADYKPEMAENCKPIQPLNKRKVFYAM
ncbi:carbonic anhydrase 4-like isoform X1 [Agrilus planipennis]|uniref:carbonic anhydrase n=1 Tax=Agrilus planipennis TaxID=224129 RepID=A0A7F5R2R4_AGRPL|nr:carbonic anhydrase 4-like isoform X1 [Agrilus planipennis]XP_025829723.1 carbonic anhydrase 4-like isoform X1 [Agrilus planipennis]